MGAKSKPPLAAWVGEHESLSSSNLGKNNASQIEERISRLEIQLHRIDQRHQPLQQRLVHGMRSVRIRCGLVGESHHSRKSVSLPPRRNIGTHMNIDQSEHVIAKRHNIMCRARLIGVSSLRLPAKSKYMNQH